MEVFKIRTGAATSLEDITAEVAGAVKNLGVREGVCFVYVPHTTAAVTINENADPAVCRDMIMEIDRLIPLQDGYLHAEGNSAAHVKSTLVGESVCIPVAGGDLQLGTWQGIFLCEFDGPRNRNVYVTVR